MLPILRRVLKAWQTDHDALAVLRSRAHLLERALAWRRHQASKQGRGAWSSTERLLDAIASEDEPIRIVEGDINVGAAMTKTYTPDTLRTLAADVLRGWRRRRIVTGNELRAHADTWQEQVREYDELLYAVGNKHEGETRHETALRYIREAEAHVSGPFVNSGMERHEEGVK